MSDETTLDTRKLQELLKAIKGNKSMARVGILASGAARGGNGPNNATIGAYQEFGTSTIPSRSFLLMPLVLFMKKKLAGAKGFDEATYKKVLETKSTVPWMEKIGKIAVELITEAFDTAGFGMWQPDRSPKHPPLVESGRLRDSISSEVVNG